MHSLVFVICLLSFVLYMGAKSDSKVMGTWRGSYKTSNNLTDVKFVFRTNSEVDIEGSAFQKVGKTTGTYAVHLNEIVIAYMWPGVDSVEVILKGRLSSTKRFAVRSIHSNSESSGIFYLGKVIQ